MSNRAIWILSPAIFSTIGMLAGYLSNEQSTIPSALGGGVIGLCIAALALAGEKRK